MSATSTWTLKAVDYHAGSTVGELVIEAECVDGRVEIITVSRWFNTEWRIPTHLNLHPKVARLALKIAREAVDLGMIA